MKHLIKILPQSKPIQFGRVCLVPIDKNDIAYQELLESEEILDFVHTIPSHSDVFYSQFKLDDYGLSTQSSDLIFLIKQRENIGFCIVQHISLQKQSCELSFYIAKQYRHHKTTLEAFIAISEFCYSHLGLKYAHLGTFEPKILQYLQRLDLNIDQKNRQQKTRLFSNETITYFTARLDFHSCKHSPTLKRLFPAIHQYFQIIEHKNDKADAHQLFQAPQMTIQNPEIRAFFENLTSNHTESV